MVERGVAGGSARHRQRDGFCHLDAVYAGRQDAAGITGAFARRIKAFGVQALKGLIAADLDRRLGILEGVLKLYPGEPHFERAIQLVRDKRDLVNSIITKARFFEERGQFVEAMDQWLGMLRTALEKNYDRLDGVLAGIDTQKKGEMR